MPRVQRRPTDADLRDHFLDQAPELISLVEKIWDIRDAFEAYANEIVEITDRRDARQAGDRQVQALIYANIDGRKFCALLDEFAGHKEFWTGGGQ